MSSIFVPGQEVCSNMDQFEKYESLYFNLSKKDQYFIEDTTGCLYPCSYPEYRVGDKKVFNMGTFGLYISYGSVTVTVKKEVRIRNSPEGNKNGTRCHKIIMFIVLQVYSYTFVSLVPDFGGTLGLFIGFSFYALWDIFKDCGLALGHILK